MIIVLDLKDVSENQYSTLIRGKYSKVGSKYYILVAFFRSLSLYKKRNIFKNIV